MCESTGPMIPTAPVAVAALISDWPGVSASESPPIQRRSGCWGVNAWRGGSVVGVGPGVSVCKSGWGSLVLTSSSLLRPSSDPTRPRKRSMYSAWLRS